MRRTVLLAPAVLALTVATATSAGAANPAVLLDVRESRSIGGAQVCVAAACLPEIPGVTNIHLRVAFDGLDLSIPEVRRTPAPDCTANLNIAYALTTPGLAAGGTLSLLAEFDRTDKNGDIIPGSHQTITQDLPLPAILPTTVDPLVSVCGSVLQ